MPAAVAEAQVLAFHNLAPLDLAATIEQYEALRLRHIYRPKTVYEHKRIVRLAARIFGDQVLEDDPHTMAAALYRHMSEERAAKYVNDAASILKDFQGWHRRQT